MNTLSPVTELFNPLFTKHQIQVFIKRDDLIHPIISGNKWRKLKYNLIEAQKQNKAGIISFGGSYSNHIHALAYACHQHNIPCVGVIRGEPEHEHNSTLSRAKKWGMQFKFVDRQSYRQRHDEEYLQQLQHHYPNYAIIPEGGSNHLALQGIAEIMDELQQQQAFDSLLLPVGSAGTFSGLIERDQGKHKILGIAVLKQADYLHETIAQLVEPKTYQNQRWRLLTEFHGGGYAKFSAQDAEQIRQLSHTFNIPFEPIYSGKMLLALFKLIEQGYFKPNHRIMLLHTGGLQGLYGLAERQLINASNWLLPDA